MRKIILYLAVVCASITSNFAQNYNWSMYIQQDYPTGIIYDSNDTMWYIVQGTGLFEKTGSSAIDHSSGLVTTNIVGISNNGSNIWVSGYGGVSMFDGSNFTNYDQSTYFNEYGILGIASKNEVWATQETYGASKYNGSTWTHYTNADGIMGLYFPALTINQTGNVFLVASDYNNGNKGYVNVFNGTNWTYYDSSSAMIVVNPLSVFCDSNNDIWVGGDNALMKFDGVNWVTIATRPEDNIEIISITEDSYGNIWFAEKNGGGVYCYNGSTVIDAGSPENFSGKSQGITADNNGSVYVCLNSGVYKVDIITSVKKLKSNDVKIYPNPITDKININIANQDLRSVNIKLYNISGEIIMSDNYSNLNNIIISTENLEEGIYFLSINNLVEKIVKY